jgi:hypothetical protein
MTNVDINNNIEITVNCAILQLFLIENSIVSNLSTLNPDSIIVY